MSIRFMPSVSGNRQVEMLTHRVEAGCYTLGVSTLGADSCGRLV
jgi:hypothetical protein